MRAKLFEHLQLINPDMLAIQYSPVSACICHLAIGLLKSRSSEYNVNISDMQQHVLQQMLRIHFSNLRI